MINFSVVGRNASLAQREDYNHWDISNKEREKITRFINNAYPELNASVGGLISIDIIPKGRDKGQIINYLIGLELDLSEIMFIGDKTYIGGNDYGIARELRLTNIPYKVFQVNNYIDTFNLMIDNRIFIQYDKEW